MSGGARDGHDFLEQAAKGGAIAAIVEEPKPVALPQLKVTDCLVALGAIAAAVRSQFNKPVVGITGSCGKTSTKEMLRLLLGRGRTHATPGNWNNRIGVPMTLFGLDPVRQDFAVIEAGINQPGEMRPLGQMICADLNVLTNIGAAHLERLGSLDNIAAEKSLLAEFAVTDSPIVLHAESLGYTAYAELAHRAVALVPEGQAVPEWPVKELVRYRIDSCGDGGHQVTVGNQSYRISSSSRGIARNAALAIVAAQRLGIAEVDLRERIEAWLPSGNRGRLETCGTQTFYIDCYNANPSSMADALDAFILCAPEAAARFYILGAMNELGSSAITQHEAIGRSLQLRPRDQVAFVGPVELTQAYERGALAVGADRRQVHCADTFEKIKSNVAQFEGAFFLKGSRSYQLELLLPPGIQE